MKNINTYIQEGLYRTLDKQTHMDLYREFNNSIIPRFSESIKRVWKDNNSLYSARRSSEETLKILRDLGWFDTFNEFCSFIGKLPKNSELFLDVPETYFFYDREIAEKDEIPKELEKLEKQKNIISVTFTKSGENVFGTQWTSKEIDVKVSNILRNSNQLFDRVSKDLRNSHKIYNTSSVIVALIYAMKYDNTKIGIKI